MTRIDSLIGRRVYLDTNILVYMLNGFVPLIDRVNRLSQLIDDDRLEVFTSELTLAELLVKPIRDNDVAAETACRDMILNNSRLTAVPVGRRALLDSARLRAATSLKLPDALHLATAQCIGCDVFLTNDSRFHVGLSTIDVVLLSDVSL